MEGKMDPSQEMYSQVREQFWKLNVNDYVEREQKKWRRPRHPGIMNTNKCLPGPKDM